VTGARALKQKIISSVVRIGRLYSETAKRVSPTAPKSPRAAHTIQLGTGSRSV